MHVGLHVFIIKGKHEKLFLKEHLSDEKLIYKGKGVTYISMAIYLKTLKSLLSF